jgi:pSer/pThr/pTyr-binding forkhead associated (FHA) protein
MIETAPVTYAAPSSALGARETAPMPTTDTPRENVIGVLDYRLHDRLLASATMFPGHYLTLSDGERDYLLQLDRAVTHIGRSTHADLLFEDARVSRRHAIIVIDGDEARVLDDRSASGTYVNGERTLGCDLIDGDVIMFGPITVTYTQIR